MSHLIPIILPDSLFNLKFYKIIKHIFKQFVRKLCHALEVSRIYDAIFQKKNHDKSKFLV